MKRYRVWNNHTDDDGKMRKGGETMWLADWCAAIGEIIAIAIGVFAVVADQWGVLVGAAILFVAIAILWAEWRAGR